MFDSCRNFETELSGKKLIVETGKFDQLANGACLVRYGDTVVNVAVTASNEPREDIDFFPLSVDFEERLYAVGKIPGSFSKREGKPSDKAVLVSRLIDRPIRPLFPKDMRNDVLVVCTVLSVDEDCSPEIAAMIGVSVALSISDIPWNGPISGVSVGYIEGDIVINPNFEQRKMSDLSLTVASVGNKILMIEAGANRINNEIMYEAIMAGHKINLSIIEFIKSIQDKIGKKKFSYTSNKLLDSMYSEVRDYSEKPIKEALEITDQKDRNTRLNCVSKEIHEKFDSIYENKLKIDECIYKIKKDIVRHWIINDSKRVDGRGIDEIRELSAEVSLLPRVHGSGLFTRGATQVLTCVTLGPISDKQMLDGIDSETSKRYLHHYNFPSYSVGETRPSRGPGRREIGHGSLAEKALIPVIPNVDEFPYTIRAVSEVLSSNGSTSQGSVCGSTLALMDAGVPIKDPVAGISCGLVTDRDKWVTMVDIQGIEDFFGDMDFKVAGTLEGITAIQMDIKIDGLMPGIIKEALEKTYKARRYIIKEVILKAISSPRKELSKYAPKVISTNISTEKIGDVIGPGGKIIQKICADYDVKIDIAEDGKVLIMGLNIDKCGFAKKLIEDIVKVPEIGTEYIGKVVRILDFGAIIEILPGKEGLCHISNLSSERVNKVTDIVNIDQKVKVKVTEIDSKGRINLAVLGVF